MDFELFDKHSRHPHQGDGYEDDIPRASERRGNYWSWIGNWLGLQPPASAVLDSDQDRARPFFGALGDNPVFAGGMPDDERLQAMRRREKRLAELNNASPPTVTAGDIVREAVVHVKEAIKEAPLVFDIGVRGSIINKKSGARSAAQGVASVLRGEGYAVRAGVSIHIRAPTFVIAKMSGSKMEEQFPSLCVSDPT